MKRYYLLNRGFQTLVSGPVIFAFLILIATKRPTVADVVNKVGTPPGVNSQIAPKSRTFKSAKAFRELWNAAVGQASVPQAQKELIAFKVALDADDTMSDSLRQLLTTVSVDGKFDLPPPLKDQPHAAFGVLHLLSLASAVSSPDKEVKKNTYELKGRVSKHFQYGSLQNSYDTYLSELNAYSEQYDTGFKVLRAPMLESRELTKLRLFFKHISDTEWETEILRWHLGNENILNLVSGSTQGLWTRLAELEMGVARELNLYLAAASNLNSTSEPRPSTVSPEIVAPTVVQCREVVEAMLNMKMPWEAWTFVEYAEQKWRIELPESKTKIKNLWKSEFQAGAKIKEQHLHRPLFIATVKVRPDMSLEEFVARISQLHKVGR